MLTVSQAVPFIYELIVIYNAGNLKDNPDILNLLSTTIDECCKVRRENRVCSFLSRIVYM